jgi:hypothetical protein
MEKTYRWIYDEMASGLASRANRMPRLATAG